MNIGFDERFLAAAACKYEETSCDSWGIQPAKAGADQQ